MILLPYSATELQLYHACLAYRPNTIRCKAKHYDPFGKVMGKSEPPGVTSVPLQPYYFDPGTAELIDLFVKPVIKERANPCHWHLILSNNGRVPKVLRCCFAIRRAPLIIPASEKEIVLRLFMDQCLKLRSITAGRDSEGRMQPLWTVNMSDGWGRPPSIN